MHEHTVRGVMSHTISLITFSYTNSGEVLFINKYILHTIQVAWVYLAGQTFLRVVDVLHMFLYLQDTQ